MVSQLQVNEPSLTLVLADPSSDVRWVVIAYPK
jgi:hypothetical protein